jgi:hypothetical protein
VINQIATFNFFLFLMFYLGSTNDQAAQLRRMRSACFSLWAGSLLNTTMDKLYFINTTNSQIRYVINNKHKELRGEKERIANKFFFFLFIFYLLFLIVCQSKSEDGCYNVGQPVGLYCIFFYLIFIICFIFFIFLILS